MLWCFRKIAFRLGRTIETLSDGQIGDFHINAMWCSRKKSHPGRVIDTIETPSDGLAILYTKNIFTFITPEIRRNVKNRNSGGVESFNWPKEAESAHWIG